MEKHAKEQPQILQKKPFDCGVGDKGDESKSTREISQVNIMSPISIIKTFIQENEKIVSLRIDSLVATCDWE